LGTVRVVLPPNLIVAALLVLALGILARNSIVKALREARAGVVRYLRGAGWAHLLALAAILGVGIWLRLDFFDTGMRWDESNSFLGYGLHDIRTLTTTYHSVNNHVFSNLLMHVSVKFFGSGFRAIRGPVLVAGVLLPLAAYVASLRIYGRQAALVTAALVAASAELIDYSTNARGYEIAALAAVSALALAPSLVRSRNPAYWGLFSLICGLGFYTVPVFIYPFAVLVAGLALAGLLSQSAQSRARFFASLAIATCAALAFTALLYGPILGDMLRLTFDFTGGAFSTARLAIGVALAIALGAAAAIMMRSTRWGSTGVRVAALVIPAGAIALAVVSNYTSSTIVNQHPQLYKELWRLWTTALPDVAKALLVLGFGASAVFVVRRRQAAFPLAAALLLVAAALIVMNSLKGGSGYTRFYLPLLALALIAAVGGLLGWEPIRGAVSGRRADLMLSLGAVAIAVSLAVVIHRDRLGDLEPGPLDSAPLIASLVGPRLTGADRVVATRCDQPIQAYAFLAQGWPPGVVVLHVSPRQAADGRTYIVVNHKCEETLRSILARAAPGAGLRANEGRKLKSFPGATVYEIGPT
jgi:Dolichyl-phosphate-mannose-protein mannosyltransferase